MLLVDETADYPRYWYSSVSQYTWRCRRAGAHIEWLTTKGVWSSTVIREPVLAAAPWRERVSLERLLELARKGALFWHASVAATVLERLQKEAST